MVGILGVLMVGAALFFIGVVVGANLEENSPKSSEMKPIDRMADRELMLLFMAVASELESRGMARRMDNNPFEDLDK